MGSAISSSQVDAKNLQKNTLLSPPPLHRPGRPSWLLAGEHVSLSWMLNSHKAWCDSSKERVPRPDTYHQVTDRRCQGQLKEKLAQLWLQNHRAQDKNSGQGCVRFFGYSFQQGQETIAARASLDLAEEREILAIANLPGPLSWYPIGKNCIDSTDEVNPQRLIFARPEFVIIRLMVDNEEVGGTRCPGSGPPCFLALPVKNHDEILQTRKLPIFLTRADRMGISQPEPYTSSCVEGFNEVLRTLEPGQHQLQMTVQFAYKTSKVTAVGLKQTSPSASPRSKIRADQNASEVYDLGSMQTVRNSSLVLRHSNPSKLIVTPVLCAGELTIKVTQNCLMDSFGYSGFQAFDFHQPVFEDEGLRKDRHGPKRKKQRAKRRRFSSG